MNQVNIGCKTGQLEPLLGMVRDFHELFLENCFSIQLADSQSYISSWRNRLIVHQRVAAKKTI